MLFEASWTRPQVVGHRGAGGESPENMLPAFWTGVTSGASAVECDVWMSRDGVPVVIHDPLLDRTTRLRGPLASHHSAELMRHGVPSLEQVLEVTMGRAVLIIELKGGDGLEEAIERTLRAYGAFGNVILFSFAMSRLQAMKEMLPEVPLVWLASSESMLSGAWKSEQWLEGMAGVGVQHDRLAESDALELRRRRVPVFCWTVPPGLDVDRLVKLGVNFIITDFPTQVASEVLGTIHRH